MKVTNPHYENPKPANELALGLAKPPRRCRRCGKSGSRSDLAESGGTRGRWPRRPRRPPDRRSPGLPARPGWRGQRESGVPRGLRSGERRRRRSSRRARGATPTWAWPRLEPSLTTSVDFSFMNRVGRKSQVRQCLVFVQLIHRPKRIKKQL